MLPSRRRNCPWARLTSYTLRPRGIGSRPRRGCKSRTHCSRPRTISPLFIGTHVLDEQADVFTADTAPIYRRYAQDAVTGARTYLPRRIGQLEPEPIDEQQFAQMAFETFPPIVTYSREDYINLLRTYSPTLAISAAARLLEDIRRLIEVRFAGQVCQHYAMSLQIAQRK